MATEGGAVPEMGRIIAALRLVADGRDEYARTDPESMDAEFLRGQASAYRDAARLLENGDLVGFIAGGAPSWRWPDEVDAAVMGRKADA